MATEPTLVTEEKRPALPALETWNNNERMRHVPPLDWMIRKLEGDLRLRISKMTAPFSDLASADPHHDAIEARLRTLCTAIDRITATAGGRRTNEPAAASLPARIETAIAHAVAALRALDATPFGRRCPYHFFERSKSEPVYGALLAAIDHVGRVVPLIRAVDPDIDEKLLA